MDERRAHQLSHHYARKLLDGERFSDVEYEEYLAFLAWREEVGQPLLGRFAGPDRSIDTVYGRCGLRPPELGGSHL